jgi:hypothetical protein
VTSTTTWFCIPSKRQRVEANAVLALWRARGYKIALWRDSVDTAPPICDLLMTGTYPGYALAVNALIAEVLLRDAQCDFVVTGGDDTEPEVQISPAEIARQCRVHFGDSTFGVMQPTGDRWGGSSQGAYIDRVAGSPWLGREFCQRINGGQGPLWHEYFHMGVDEELQAVALRLGVYWPRPDLTHFHRHWARPRGHREDMPTFLQKANSPEEWERYRQLFKLRHQAGFPGHEPA